MKTGIFFSRKFFYNFSAVAFAGLAYSFFMFDAKGFEALSGNPGFWMGAVYAFLAAYYLFVILRSFMMMKNAADLRLFYIVSILVCFLALFTFVIDQALYDQAADRYPGLIYAGDKRMLLVSVLIKFLALVTAGLSVFRAEQEQ